MKPFKLFFLTVIVHFSLTIKAQDDPNLGVYIDGVKVSELNCYSFGNLTVVLPYNDVYSKFDKITIVFCNGTNPKKGVSESNKNSLELSNYSEKSIAPAALFKYVKGKYLIYEVFSKDKQESNGDDLLIQYKKPVKRGTLQCYSTYSGKPEELFYVSLLGMTATGQYNETYLNNGQFYKSPVMSSEDLYSVQLPLKNRVKLKMMADHNFKEVDLSLPCSVTGTKVDFNNLGKSNNSSNTSSNSNTNSNISNNTAVKAETLTKTTAAIGKTIITTVAPTSALAVKPLDKTKPGYFEEKSEDKKFMYRNGYQKGEGVYHGEVREYENNQLEKIIVFTDGIEDGLYVTFSDGKVEWQGTYKNGKKDGVWKHFNNGQLQESEKYIQGEKQD